MDYDEVQHSPSEDQRQSQQQRQVIKFVLLNDDAEDITNKLHSPYVLLLTPAQREKRIFTECTGVVPAKHPPKIKSELFSLLYSAREGKIMRTFLCEGARFL